MDPATGAQTLVSTDINTAGANNPVKYFAGSLWGVHEANNKVNRIDPTSGTTLASITGTVGSRYGLGVGGGYVFACGERGVMQIDPATNTVTKNLHLPRFIRGASNTYACGASGVIVIDYINQTFEEIILDAAETKCVRALPNGQIVAGAYAAPWMHVLETA